MTRPAVTAALDQVSAAVRDVCASNQRMAAQFDGITVGVSLTPALERILEPLTRLAEAGVLTTCEHVSISEPTYWARWRPGRLRCALCAARVADAVRGRREDRTCDVCRRLRDGLNPIILTLPGVVLEDPGDGSVRTVGPTTIYFGACAPCLVELKVPAPSGVREQAS